MERAGTAPGLSSYDGRSSIYHSAPWERLDALEHGEVKGHGKRGPSDKPRTVVTPELHDRILGMLRRGASYGAISRELSVSESVPRTIGRRNGIDRAMLQTKARCA